MDLGAERALTSLRSTARLMRARQFMTMLVMDWIRAPVSGRTPDTGAAFPGINPNVGANQMLFPIGRSAYNALQVKLTSQKANPVRGMTNANFVVSYALSRLTAMARDGDFINNGFSFRDTSLRGPNGLDRRHQLSAGAVMDFKYGASISFITH